MLAAFGLRKRLLLALVLIAALGARVAPLAARRAVPDAPFILDPDSTYHLLRAEAWREGFPWPLVVDPRIAWPTGAAVIWPLGYDALLLLIAAPARALGGAGAEAVAVGSLNAIIGLALVLLTAELARRSSEGRSSGLLAALLVALSPVAIAYSQLGNADHHAAECLLLVLLALGTPSALRGQGRLALALLIAAALQVWHGALLFAALPALAACLQARRGDAMANAALTLAFASALAFPFGLAQVLLGAPPLLHTHASLFQPLALYALAGLCGLAALVFGGRRAGLPWLAASGLVAALGAAREGLAGFSFLTREWSPWLGQIRESQPLLDGTLAGSWHTLWWTFSPLVLLAPLGVGTLLRSQVASRAVVLAGLAIFLPAALLQARFAHHLLPWVALLIELACGSLPKRRVPVRGLCALVLVLGYLPSLARGGRPGTLEAAWARVGPLLDILRERSRQSGSAPTGVLSEWTFGHWIELHGRHPVVVNNFGTHVGDIELPSLLFGLPAEREAEAVARLSALRVGWLLLDAEADPERSPGTLAARLLAEDGSGLGHFRLVGETRWAEADRDPANARGSKLFERVAGAQIVVRGAPGAELVATIELRTPGGREIRWQTRAPIVAGVATLLLPHASSPPHAGAAVLSTGFWRLEAGGEARALRGLAEDAVRHGQTSTLDW